MRLSSVASVALAVAVATALAGPGALGAQELTGAAVGPDGEPLPEIPVVLHRVGGGGGAFVATDTTDGEGRFSFSLDPAVTAIHFAALRYDDRMYIGPAVESGGEPISGYMLRVEPESEAGAVASALSGQPPGAPAPQPALRTPQRGGGDSDLGAFLLVGLLALAAAVVFYIAAPRYRRNRTRDALIELAETENALADTEASAEERTRREETRDRLRRQLAPGS